MTYLTHLTHLTDMTSYDLYDFYDFSPFQKRCYNMILSHFDISVPCLPGGGKDKP